MAGNIVKWWKHKILGGYKQFSVQECTTDSEELMYHQVRAPSSCSAPPDLLLVSDRENNMPLKTPAVVNIITTTTTAAGTTCATTSGNSSQHHHTQQQHQQKHNIAKELFSKNAQNTKINNSNSSNSKNSSKLINIQTTQNHQQHHQQHQSHSEANQQQQSRQHVREEQRIHLEEFTCDVSVEGGKSSQPLQFSFTFYDLDGHHGKITKDDIVGIVYTIYESIGKSVVVPHCGSKTINVRLTVSPEGKTKATANKLKKMQQQHQQPGPGGVNNMLLESNNKTAIVGTGAATTAGHSRRQHRYRPRKLIKSDDEDDDSTSEKDLQLTAMAAVASAAAAASTNISSSTPNSNNKSKTHATTKYINRTKLEQHQLLTTAAAAAGGNCCQSLSENNRNLENNMELLSTTTSNCHQQQQHSNDNNLYANVSSNLKCCQPAAATAAVKDTKKCDSHAVPVTESECRGCVYGNVQQQQQQKTTDMYLKQASTRVKMLRKARKQKYQDHCLETRQRSLSVGNETCWKNRHTKHAAAATNNLETGAATTTNVSPTQQLHGDDVVDGVQLRNPHRNLTANSLAGVANRNSAECWKTALNRNDLISIIRESMEKNRLCFQLNGKPQASVSPIRQSQQRQRSNTVSKIPTLIANHSNVITNNSSSSNNNYHQQTTTTAAAASNNNSIIINNDTSNMLHHHDIISSSNNANHHHHQHHQQQHHHSHQQHQHPQPHIPIYHQQMAINPAVLAAQNGIVHSKMNLCGYDSFLHATICGGGTSHSPPPPTTTITPSLAPIATVQPLMHINHAATATSMPQHQLISPKLYAQPLHQIKTSKILRSGTFSQNQHQQQHVAVALTAQNSPQQHGYQRLAATNVSASATKHNLATLNSQNPSMERAQVDHLEKWLHEREHCALNKQKSKKDVKNFDNQLFAKLSEKLQDSSLNAERQEMWQRRKLRAHARAQKARNASRAVGGVQQEKQQQLQLQQQMARLIGDKSATKSTTNYATLIPIHGDPIECENLLGNQTSDEENSADMATPTAAPTAVSVENAVKLTAETTAIVETADLLDLNDDEEEDDDDDDDEEEVDEEEEEDFDPHVEDNVNLCGRNSSNSNSNSSSVGAAVVATTSAANNSSSSSLIHRYVHEHIHHHYHHFEDKEE